MLSYRLKESTQEEIFGAAKDIFAERLEQTTVKILKACEKETKTMESLLNVFDRLFLRCAKIQAEGQKGEIRYIHIFALKSCLFTGKYELQINLFDANSYLDPCYMYDLWYPEIFIEYYQNDLEYFRNNNSLLQLRHDSFQDIKIRYYDLYLVMVGRFITKEIHKATVLSSYQDIKKHPDIQFIYGGYMDKGIQVYPPLEVIM